MSSQIGLLNEKHLHALLKEWYAEPGDRLETPVDGYVVDIVRDGLLIEIQTRNFSAIKTKLLELTDSHRLRLVYPVAAEKWIVSLPKDEHTTTSPAPLAQTRRAGTDFCRADQHSHAGRVAQL